MTAPGEPQEQPPPVDLTLREIIGSIWTARITILRNFLVMAVASAAVALLLPVWFASTFVILPSTAGNQDIAPGSMGFGNPLAGLGFGLSNEELNTYISVLKSRDVRDALIEAFDLLRIYKVDTIEDALLILDDRIEISVSDEGALRVLVTDRDPQQTKALADGLLAELGSTMMTLGVAAGQRQTRFIASRIGAVEAELLQIEAELESFTQKYGTFDLPAQIPIFMEKLIEMELELAQAEIEYNIATSSSREGSPELAFLLITRNEIRAQLDKMMAGNSTAKLIPNLDELPAIAVRYAQYQREIQINSSILEYLYPQLEQARLKAAKDEPTLQILDYPQLPQKKYKPHRALIVISATLFTLLISCFWAVFQQRWATLSRSVSGGAPA